MRHLKKFNEGKYRIEIKGNQVVAGSANLPQNWTTSDDYMSDDNGEDQKMGVDAKTLISPLGNDYAHIWDVDDHIDPKEIDNLIKPHVKKFNDFGFNPANESLVGNLIIAWLIYQGYKRGELKLSHLYNNLTTMMFDFLEFASNYGGRFNREMTEYQFRQAVEEAVNKLNRD